MLRYFCSHNIAVPSPPLSPLKSSDEASNFKAILESVCHTDKIGKEAISQLCNHVKADPQEKSVSGTINYFCTTAMTAVLICITGTACSPKSFG